MKTLSERVKKASEDWEHKYSEPGIFEESGQREAFFAGAKAMYKAMKYQKKCRAKSRRSRRLLGIGTLTGRTSPGGL
jgi:hypothetical protein